MSTSVNYSVYLAQINFYFYFYFMEHPVDTSGTEINLYWEENRYFEVRKRQRLLFSFETLIWEIKPIIDTVPVRKSR